MVLTKYNLKNIQADNTQVPSDLVFDLPEKVLQFGTGVLLRGLPDFFIDKANRAGVFNGRVVVVKSTDGGDAQVFDKQDCLYTQCIRGIDSGKEIHENIVNASISRVLSGKSQWNEILQCAHQPQMKVIISNTTEVGIQLVNESIGLLPPVSFPAKLLAFLYERYKAFGGSADSGMVIVPTELIVDNGKKLESIVLELAHLNGLNESFIQWLETANHFCSSLVDRIVPGKPNATQTSEIEKELGYKDDLLIVSEAYSLWAIEGDEYVQSVLSFAQTDPGVVITPNIGLFRELKLRMLNGTHTVSCGIAYLAGFETVKKAMDEPWMCNCISEIMMKNIAPAIPYPVADHEAAEFGAKVLDRFRNGSIEHLWINITMQFTSKLKMRVVPVLQNYYQKKSELPEYIVAGFAAWMLFMRAAKKEGNAYFGHWQGQDYPIKDDSAEILYKYWRAHPDAAHLNSVFSNNALFGEDLDQIPGFTAAVREKLLQMMDIGVAKSIQLIKAKKEVA